MLHVVYKIKHQEPLADIVFVPGISVFPGRSSALAFNTWGDGDDSSKFTGWPKVIGKDIKLPIRVWLLEHNDAHAPHRTTMTVEEIATTVLREFSAEGIGMGKPVMFIAHGYGGHFVKQFLKHSATSTDNGEHVIARNTRAVVFLSTRHPGMGMMEYVEWYRAWASAQGVRTLAFYATKSTNGNPAPDQELFDPGVPHADMPVHSEDATYATIAKISPQHSSIYRKVLGFLTGILDPQAQNRTFMTGNNTPAQETPSQGIPIPVQPSFRTRLVITLQGLKDSDLTSIITLVPGANYHDVQNLPVSDRVQALIKFVESGTGQGLDVLAKIVILKFPQLESKINPPNS